MLPVERLAHERRAADCGGRRTGTRRSARPSGPPTRRAIVGHCAGGRREAGVRVRGRAVVVSGVQSLPFQSIRWSGRLAGHALPPDVAVVGLRAVGEDRVALDRVHRVRVRLARRVGRDAEEPVLGVDGVELAVVAELHPRDVVADRLDLPVLERRHEHRQVGLAARARERAADVLDVALGARELEDQHVLGQPALVAGDHRRDPQREALLAQQRVAAVARAVGPDLARLGEVDDVLLLVARPRAGLLARPRAASRSCAGTARSRRRRRARRARPCPCGS